MRRQQGTRGPATRYRPKTKRVSATLTPFALKILEAAYKRTGETRADIIEKLLRDYGASVVFEPVGDEEAVAG